MSEILIIARHSTAADPLPGQKDMARKLTSEGISEALNTAEWLNTEGYIPDLILTSPAIRTRQTAEIYARELTNDDGIVQAETFLYHAAETEVLEFLSQAPENEQVVMVVGHNPAISGLAELLSNRAISYLSPGGAVVLELKQPGWQNLRSEPQILRASHIPES